MAQDRSNIRAGIATLGTVAAASLLLWGAIEWHASRRIGYTVRFTREQGVYGLKPGAPLLVGGMPRGSVVGVEPEIAGGAVTAYLVRVEIDPEVPVSARTRISAQAMDVSGDAVLVAEGVSLLARNPLIGPGGATSGTLPEDSVIGASDPDEFGAWGGAASSASMRSLYRSWFAETAPAQGLAERLRGSFADFEAKARPLARDAKALGEDLSSDLATWRDDFKALREAAVDAFARLGASEGAANDAVVPALKELGEDIKAIPELETRRASAAADAFDAAVGSVRRLSARSGELSATLSDEELSLGATAADYSISAQELSATKREAVLSPWKLLGTPDEAARRRAAAVDAVRAYAEAATQHRIAMKGVEDALRRDEPLLAKDPALVTLLRSRLEAANALFESRLAGMEDVLLGPAREAEAPPGQRP